MPLKTADSVEAARSLLAQARGAVVVVPVYNAPEDVLRCFDALFTHTPSKTSILIVDDRGVERRALDVVARAAERTDHHVLLYQRPENGGFVRGCNDAFAITTGHDVILVNSDVVVGPEWYDRMSAAASKSNTIATVSALTNYGTMLSVPERNTPHSQLPGGITPESASKAIAEASLGLLPTIPTGVGHCLYIRRAVLNVVGGFDLAFARGYGEEVDFCQRAIKSGFTHVCADDVFVYHRGNASFGAEASEIQLANEKLINTRYPWYRPAVERASRDEYSPLAHAIETARRALLGFRIGVDGRSLGMNWAGTQVVTYNTIVELCRRLGEGRVVVFASRALPTTRERDLERLGAVVKYCDATTPDRDDAVDVIYRPYQLTTVDELRFLLDHGRRVVVSQLDLIAFDNPAYFSTDQEWIDYRELTRIVLRSVDGVTFISRHVLDKVRRDDLLPAETPVAVTYCGTDSLLPEYEATPIDTLTVDDRPIMVCLGNAYLHKNRRLALELVRTLASRGLDSHLVFAGAVPPFGSSDGTEAAVYLEQPDLRQAVTELGEITEQQKAWLYSKASLVVYPTVSEGFGLVPFEAARHGVPVLCTRQGSLDEVLPSDLPTIDDFDLARAAELAHAMIVDAAERARVCNSLNRRAQDFTWERTVDELLAHVNAVMRAPRNRTRSTKGELDSPISIDGSLMPKNAIRQQQLEDLVARLQQLTWARRFLVPAGSRRQTAVRNGINWARSKAHLADHRA